MRVTNINLSILVKLLSEAYEPDVITGFHAIWTNMVFFRVLDLWSIVVRVMNKKVFTSLFASFFFTRYGNTSLALSLLILRTVIRIKLFVPYRDLTTFGFSRLQAC